MTIFDNLSDIRNQLFDASSDVKEAFNQICKYFDNSSKYYVLRDDNFIKEPYFKMGTRQEFRKPFHVVPVIGTYKNGVPKLDGYTYSEKTYWNKGTWSRPQTVVLGPVSKEKAEDYANAENEKLK